MKRKPDFILPMQGDREVLEVYGWPLPKEKDMAITFGDRLIDSGYYDITPEQEQEKDDCAWPECECPRKAPSGSAAMREEWECMGRKQSLPEPGECNWPDCGCDPHATKVIESLLEQGWTGPPPAPSGSAATPQISANVRHQASVTAAATPLTRENVARAIADNLVASTDAAGTPIISGINSATTAILALADARVSDSTAESEKLEALGRQAELEIKYSGKAFREL
jgi:hypothetical protein